MTALLLAPYAGILALGYMFLSMYVVRSRRKRMVGVGTGGDIMLERAIRAHAHFAEYVPFCLLLFWLVGETHAASPALLQLGCLLLILSRLLHAYSLLVHEPRRKRYKIRVAAMVITFTLLGVSGILLILKGLTATVTLG